MVCYNFLLIDATDRSKISSDQKRLFIAVSLYPLSFFANTPFNILLIPILLQQKYRAVWGDGKGTKTRASSTRGLLGVPFTYRVNTSQTQKLLRYKWFIQMLRNITYESILKYWFQINLVIIYKLWNKRLNIIDTQKYYQNLNNL